MAHGGLWYRSDEGDSKKAYKALLEGGDSGFSALLAGYRNTDGRFYTLGAYDHYWGATESGGSSACRYGFCRKNGKLTRYDLHVEKRVDENAGALSPAAMKALLDTNILSCLNIAQFRELRAE